MSIEVKVGLDLFYHSCGYELRGSVNILTNKIYIESCEKCNLEKKKEKKNF